MVAHRGFEPLISALRGRCPGPLDECASWRCHSGHRGDHDYIKLTAGCKSHGCRGNCPELRVLVPCIRHPSGSRNSVARLLNCTKLTREPGGKLDIGKLRSGTLAELLANLGTPDPRVIVGPAIGEDCAVVDMGDRLLVAKSDPITFAAERAGWYAVQVNANDVACSGAAPKWFLPTILLPESADLAQVRALFEEVSNACRDLGVAVIGGHTEVTLGLDRPIVAGTMLGEILDRSRLVTTGGARDGDSVCSRPAWRSKARRSLRMSAPRACGRQESLITPSNGRRDTLTTRASAWFLPRWRYATPSRCIVSTTSPRAAS